MPEQIENRMVVDSQWDDPEEVETVLSEHGFHETRTGEFVSLKDAYEYALDCCLNGSEEQQKEFKEMLVEWFYSGGNWREE